MHLNYIRVQEQKLLLKILKFDILRVSPIQIPTKKGQTLRLCYEKFTVEQIWWHFWTILGSRNKTKWSEFGNSTSQGCLPYKCWPRNVDSWVLRKFHCCINFMHFLLPICCKFTRDLLAHQIFCCHFLALTL
jgi:hypothetical protein